MNVKNLIGRLVMSKLLNTDNKRDNLYKEEIHNEVNP